MKIEEVLKLLAGLEFDGPSEKDVFDTSYFTDTITSAICNSFKTEILTAVHNFTASTGNVFKIALYTSSATQNKTTTSYNNTNEVATANNYTQGGINLTNVTPTLDSDTAMIDFNAGGSHYAQWTSATFTANGALIYNSSASNKAVLTLAFGADYTCTNGSFTVNFPVAAAATALVQLT
jgi:hypothetical protein